MMRYLIKYTTFLIIFFAISNCSTSTRSPSSKDEFSRCEATTEISKDADLYFRKGPEDSDEEYEDLCELSVLSLHPTQFAVGFLEVKRKTKKLEDMSAKKLRNYQKINPEPIVIGPNGEFFIIDHHHLARALYDAGISSTYGIILENWYNSDVNSFWAYMHKKKWIYLNDENGRSRSVGDLLKIKTVKDLADDPYRSLAGQTRCDKKASCKKGEWFKEPIPFIEFQWAQHFRETPSIAREVEMSNFADALKEASEEIKRLNGKLP